MVDGQRKVLSRRDFLRLGLLTGAAMGIAACAPRRDDRDITVWQSGEWITQTPYQVEITNGRQSSITEVNIRSSWDIDVPKESFADSIVGKVLVGTRLQAQGEIKGKIPKGISPFYVADAFFAIKREILDALPDTAVIDRRYQKYQMLYINSKLVKIIGPGDSSI